MAASTTLTRVAPILDWLPRYPRDDLSHDLRAGLTVAILVIPQAMAYAALAGVPAITGLYSAMVAMTVYAVLGTSRFISVGPVAIDSLLTAATVGPLASGDATRYLALASGLAVLIGLIQIAAGLARLGQLVSLLSVPVISGFTSAAALTIAVTQIGPLLGLRGSGSSSTLVEAMRALWPTLGTIDAATTVVGCVSLLALWSLKRFAPRLPGPLVVIALASVLVVLAPWLSSVRTLGAVPSGIPSPGLPALAWSDLLTLSGSAAAIALVSFMESISTGTAFARRTRTTVDPDQELIGVGAANAASGLFQGFCVAGGLSRGAVNVAAGARSQVSGLFAAVLIAISLFTLTGVLAHLPKTVLAAIILVAVSSLVDIKGAREIAAVRRSDVVALLATAVATLTLGPVPGLGVGVAVSLALFLRPAVQPHLPELGQLPGQDVYRNVTRYDTLRRPDTLILRVDAPLSFVSARAVNDRISHLVRERAGVRYVIVDGSAMISADYTGIDSLLRLAADLDAAAVQVHLAALRGPVRDILDRHEGYRLLVEQGRVHSTVPLAVSALPSAS